MFAQNQIVYRIPARTYTRRFNTKCSVNKTFRASIHNLSDENSMAISEVKTTKLLHIIAFERDGREGVYSMSERDKQGKDINHVLAFRTFDEALRYKTLLEAEMDFNPYVQFVSRFELNHSCNVGNYNCRVVNSGTLVIPPVKTRAITDWEWDMMTDL
tara:strand:- start:832 stop:1305 length:474 start_codon:yes stop_codon:yes gene_type:complete